MSLLLGSGARVVGHETKPLVVANIAGGAADAAARRLRHPDRGLPAQRLAAQPDHRRRRPRAAGRDAAARRRRAACRPGRAGRAGRAGRPRAAGEGARGIGPGRASSARSSCRSFPCWRRWRPPAWRSTAEALAGAGRRVRRRDGPPGVRDLRRRRPRVQPRLAQAARADPLLRAEPAQGQADQDRLLDRRLGPRRAQAGPPDDRQAARLAAVLEAAVDLHRGPAAARLRAGRPAAHHLPPGRGGDRSPLARPTRTCRTSRSARTWAGASAAPSWPARRT